jgi:hypothetical protein
MQDSIYKSRKQTRLKEYNYTQSGYYYVTICTHNHNLLFGEIIAEPVGSRRAVTTNALKFHNNQYGKIVQEEWENTQRLRKDVELDTY